MLQEFGRIAYVNLSWMVKLPVVNLPANILGMQTLGSRQNYWKMERDGEEISEYL